MENTDNQLVQNDKKESQQSLDSENDSTFQKEERMVESQTIRWDESNPRILDMSYYSRLNRLSNLCLFAGIWTMVMGVVELIGGNSDVWGKVFTTVSNVCFLLLCIFAYTAIRKRKPNAMFYARFIMATCVLSWVILVASGGFELTGGNIFFGIGTLIYGSLGLYWSFADDEVKEVFPKEYRKTSWKDYVFCFGCVLLPFILAGLIIVFALGMSHLQAPNNLKEGIEYANGQCPIDMGYGVVTAIEYNNNTVTYNYLIDESMVEMNKLEQNKEQWTLLTIKKSATTSDGNLLLEEIIKAKASFEVKFMGNQTGKTVKAICDTQTIKDCVKNCTAVGDVAYLQNTIEMQKLILPIKIDDNTTFTDIYLKNEAIQYVYDVNDINADELDFDYLKECALLEMGISSSEAIYSTYTKMIDLGYGMQYNYKINGEYVGAYNVSSSEINNAITHPLTESEYLLKYLEATVAKVNRKELPFEIDQGLTLKSIEIENVCLIYNYTVDERLIRLDVIEENKKELKASLLESDLQTMVGILTSTCNKGISYHFMGNRSKKTVVIDCPYYEINSLMNK